MVKGGSNYKYYIKKGPTDSYYEHRAYEAVSGKQQYIIAPGKYVYSLFRWEGVKA